MIVQSTQTFISLNKELHELRLAINGLKGEKELIARSKKEAQEGLKDVQDRAIEFQNQINELSELSTKIIEQARNSINLSCGIVQEAKDVVEGYLKQIQTLDRQIEDSQVDLQIVQNKTQVEHHKIVKENEELELKRKDLDIYKKRLEAIVVIHNLDMKIL